MPIIYRLDLIQNASLAGFYFEERKNWNLMKWAEESFGVYHSDALLYVSSRSTRTLLSEPPKLLSIHLKKPKRVELAH